MINLKEFAVFLQQIDLQPALSPSSIRQLFTVFDETHSGFINFFEFCHVVFPELDVEGMAEDAEGFTYCMPAFELSKGAPGAQAGGPGACGAMGPCCNSSSAPSSEYAKPTLHALARGQSKGSMGSMGSMGSGFSSSKSTSAPGSPSKTPRPSPLRGPLKAGPVAERLGIGSDAGAAGAAGAPAADDASRSPSKRRSVPPVPPFRGKPAGSTDSNTEEAEAEGSLVRVGAQNAVPAPPAPAAPAPAEAEGAKPEGDISTDDAAESAAPSPALGSVAPSPALGAVPPSRSWDSLGEFRAGQEMASQWGRSRPEDAQRARLRGLAGGRGAWAGSLGRLPVEQGSPALGAATWGTAVGLQAQLDEMMARLARLVSQSEAKMAERLDKIEAHVADGFAEAKAAAAEAADPVKLRLAQKQMHMVAPAHLSPPDRTGQSRVSKRGSVSSGLLSGRASHRSGDSRESQRSGDSRESQRSGDSHESQRSGDSDSRESRATRAASQRQMAHRPSVSATEV